MNLTKPVMGIILIGVILFFAPQRVILRPSDEYVNAWEGSILSSGGEFVLTTGITGGGDGFGHTLEVWNNESIPMNGTVTNLAVSGSSVYLFEGGVPSLEFFLSEEEEYNIKVTGVIETSDSVEIYGRFHYFRHMEPYTYWDYPYRFISYGVLGIGIIMGLITYLRDESETNT